MAIHRKAFASIFSAFSKAKKARQNAKTLKAAGFAGQKKSRLSKAKKGMEGFFRGKKEAMISRLAAFNKKNPKFKRRAAIGAGAIGSAGVVGFGLSRRKKKKTASR